MADSSSPLDSTASVPDHFVCPISLEIMQDPVICSDGNTYERREIARWLTNHDTSPKTNMILANKVLIPNHAIKSGIARFLSAIPEEKAKPKKMKVGRSCNHVSCSYNKLLLACCSSRLARPRCLLS